MEYFKTSFIVAYYGLEVNIVKNPYLNLYTIKYIVCQAKKYTIYGGSIENNVRHCFV